MLLCVVLIAQGKPELKNLRLDSIPRAVEYLSSFLMPLSGEEA